MAWIESHQELATNPKTKRAARTLGVTVPTMIGHLHLLWWWTLDHAFDGDLSGFDALDLADAAQWEDDPDTFVKALIDCGPRDKSGFLDADWQVHDWGQFTEALATQRRVSMQGNHTRHHVNKGVVSPSCDLCQASDGTDAGVPKDSDRTPTGAGRDSTEPDLTEPNPTQDQDPRPPDTDPVTESFELFWQIYPARRGKKVGKANALIEWRKLTDDQRRRAWIGAKNLAASDELPKDAERFLRRAKGGKGDFPFDDWQTPAAPAAGARASPAPGTNDDDWTAGWGGHVAAEAG